MTTPMAYDNLKRRTAAALREIHSALDDGLGDSDVTHMDDDGLRNAYPVQWAAERLAKLIADLKE